MPRDCGGCNACCNVLHINDPQLQKPAGTLCQHWKQGAKCTLYSSRPNTCRSYSCPWLDGYGQPHERPDKVGVLIGMPIPERPVPNLAAHVGNGSISAHEFLDRTRNEHLVARVWEVRPGGLSSAFAIKFAKSQLEKGTYIVFTFLGGRRVLYCPMNKPPLQGADFEIRWFFEL